MDSFVPQATDDQTAEDWSDDLHGFLSVLLGVSKDALEVPPVPAGMGGAPLQLLIEEIRSNPLGQSMYADIDSSELAHTFEVAMRLKALSLNISSLPRLKARATCWWAGHVTPAWNITVRTSQSVAAGHYDILKHADVIEGLAAQWLLEGSMID
ncbi:hypothetical protein D3C80_1249920 [compost metagenome]